MRTTFLMGLLALAACNGDKTGSTTGETGTTDTQTTDTNVTGGFAITGTAVTIAQTPAAEGLCASVVDPTPALSGGAPLTLATGTVGAGGALSFTDVTTTSTIGLLIDVRDCEGDPSTVYPSATGIAFASYDGLVAGDTLADQVAFSLDNTTLGGLVASAGADPSYTGDLTVDGFLMGFVLDGTGAPVGGATVTCTGAGCPAAWYLDGDPTDGLFTSAAGLNTATDATAGASFVFPKGPIGNYSADDGGTHTFASQLNGSNPGIATFTAFYGQ